MGHLLYNIEGGSHYQAHDVPPLMLCLEHLTLLTLVPALGRKLRILAGEMPEELALVLASGNPLLLMAP